MTSPQKALRFFIKPVFRALQNKKNLLYSEFNYLQFNMDWLHILLYLKIIYPDSLVKTGFLSCIFIRKKVWVRIACNFKTRIYKLDEE